MVWPGPAPEIDALAFAHVALACAYAYTESLGLDRHFDRRQTALTPGPSPRLRLRRANARKAVHALVEATPELTSRPRERAKEMHDELYEPGAPGFEAAKASFEALAL